MLPVRGKEIRVLVRAPQMACIQDAYKLYFFLYKHKYIKQHTFVDN